jgi:dTDP-4-dehydrorhamnose 3,5-epimerase-like enzyme
MGEELSVGTCRLIEFPVVHDQRGNLTFIEGGEHVPFEIKRVYYLYDVPGGATRAGHAHRELEQVMVAASGSFDVIVDDGTSRDTVTLNRSYFGLYVPNYIWREVVNFSSGAVCLVLASDHFDEADYFRSYDKFLEAAPRAGRDASAPDPANARSRHSPSVSRSGSG